MNPLPIPGSALHANIKHTKAIGPSDPNAAGFLPEVKSPTLPGG